jgi:hypothetical protein
MIFCVFLKINFIERYKNNFDWLLIVEKMKDSKLNATCI